MKEHILRRTQLIERPLEEVFDFFSNAYNLEQLTPAFLRFKVLTPAPIEMGPGTLIDYRLQLFGVPFRWRTEIESFVPNASFVDQQLRGPYALWHHTHTFCAVNRGTQMEDTVRYALPLGALGNLAHPLFVRRMVGQIFDYRASAMSEVFPAA